MPMASAASQIELALAHAVPFTLASFRVLGIFVFAPMLSSVIIPSKNKALLGVMLTAALYPSLDLHVTPALAGRMDVFSAVPVILGETLIGFVIGVLATLPLAALEMSGVLMGQQMGLGLARVYNPEADYDVDVLGQLLFYVGAGVFFGLGGLDIVIAGVINSFERVPLGGITIGQAPLETIVGVLSSGFELAMQAAAPVTAIILLLIIVFGAVSKTMPQINIMSVGFTVKIMAGVAMTALALYAVQTVVGEKVHDALAHATNWVDALGNH